MHSVQGCGSARHGAASTSAQVNEVTIATLCPLVSLCSPASDPPRYGGLPRLALLAAATPPHPQPLPRAWLSTRPANPWRNQFQLFKTYFMKGILFSAYSPPLFLFPWCYFLSFSPPPPGISMRVCFFRYIFCAPCGYATEPPFYPLVCIKSQPSSVLSRVGLTPRSPLHFYDPFLSPLLASASSPDIYFTDPYIPPLFYFPKSLTCGVTVSFRHSHFQRFSWNPLSRTTEDTTTTVSRTTDRPAGRRTEQIAAITYIEVQ